MSARADLVLPGSVLDAIAERAVPRVLAQLRALEVETQPSPWLTVGEAAQYLRCSRQRIYDLLSARRLRKHKDGSRVLIRRSDLDAYLTEPGPGGR